MSSQTYTAFRALLDILKYILPSIRVQWISSNGEKRFHSLPLSLSLVAARQVVWHSAAALQQAKIGKGKKRLSPPLPPLPLSLLQLINNSKGWGIVRGFSVHQKRSPFQHLASLRGTDSFPISSWCWTSSRFWKEETLDAIRILLLMLLR